MAKRTRKRKDRGKSGGDQAAAKGRPWYRSTGARIAILLAVAAAVFLGWRWSAEYRAEQAFLERARAGQAALKLVVRPPDEGGGHVRPGQSVSYLNDPPTSGPHDPKAVDPGVYDTVQRRELLVHSLEHGMVVIYYDEPAPGVMSTLEAWAGLYGGHWSGVVVVPRPGLGETVLLTAWNRLLLLDAFDANAAAAFIDTFRGRGPENPVR